MRRQFKSSLLHGTIYPEKCTNNSSGDFIIPVQIPGLSADEIAKSDFRALLKCEFGSKGIREPFFLYSESDTQFRTVYASINGCTESVMYILPLNVTYVAKGPNTTPQMSYAPGNIYVLERLKADDSDKLYITPLSDLSNVVNSTDTYIFPKDISIDGCALTVKQIAELAQEFNAGIGSAFELSPDGTLSTKNTFYSRGDVVADYGDVPEHLNVSLLALKEAFDSLDIRGRNLIKNSSNCFECNKPTLVNSTLDGYYTDGRLPGYVKCMRLQLDSSTLHGGVYYDNYDISYSGLGMLVPFYDEFVVSFYACANHATYLSVSDVCEGQQLVEHSGDGDGTFPIGTDWTRHWVKCKHTSNAINIGIYQDGTKGVADTILSIACIKVELGNTPTDWSIDPGDILRWITDINKTLESKVSVSYDEATETLKISTSTV